MPHIAAYQTTDLVCAFQLKCVRCGDCVLLVTQTAAHRPARFRPAKRSNEDDVVVKGMLFTPVPTKLDDGNNNEEATSVATQDSDDDLAALLQSMTTRPKPGQSSQHLAPKRRLQDMQVASFTTVDHDAS